MKQPKWLSSQGRCSQWFTYWQIAVCGRHDPAAVQGLSGPLSWWIAPLDPSRLAVSSDEKPRLKSCQKVFGKEPTFFFSSASIQLTWFLKEICESESKFIVDLSQSWTFNEVMDVKVIFKITMQIQDTSGRYFSTWKKKKSKNEEGLKFYQGATWVWVYFVSLYISAL